MRSVERIGALDPLTQSGTIVTNNITASCCKLEKYLQMTNLIKEGASFSDASFPHHLADLALLPAKMFPALLLDTQESQYVEGTRTYVRFFKWFAR